MKVLLDTNILISLDPTSTEQVQQDIRDAVRLANIASKGGIQLYVHPAQFQDFAKDHNERRRSLRQILASKYQLLDPAPKVQPDLERVIGLAATNTNRLVDDQLLAAVFAPAVTYLVTEDRQIHRKALRAGIGDRVLLLSDAIRLFAGLFDSASAPPPAVRHLKAYELNRRAPIWESFRSDYPPFDDWLIKCAHEHRDTWVIPGDNGYAAVTIINKENAPPNGLSGKILKICSLKSDETYAGFRYGELLLKAIFRFGLENRYDWYFIETYPKQEALLRLLQQFGFEVISEKPSGELVLAKPVHPMAGDASTKGFDFHRRYGPYFFDWRQPIFIIPIRPQFEKLLFPDQQDQGALIEGEHAFGNAIRKAYLCHSQITKIAAGSILLFYRSMDLQGITAIGVAEDALRSRDADEIAQFVVRRTVYSMNQIKQMAEKPVLAIQFRHARQIEPHIRLHELIDAGILSRAPQSIVTVSEEVKEWIMTRVGQ